MTEEQQAWFEYGDAFGLMKDYHRKHNAARILLQNSLNAGCELTPTQKRILEGWKHSTLRGIVQEAWDARKKAMAWIPTRRRSCENCGCLCRDEDNPSQWYCVRYNIDEDGLNPDEASCAEWEPMEGGEP